jgi:hypothetical protein
MNVNEPLMTCRNLSFDDIKTRDFFADRGRGRRRPVYWPFGVRHIGGMIATRALVWNWRGSKVMATEKAQVGKTRKAESRKASFCVGLLHSSDEVLVMSMERREQLISEKRMRVTNQTGDYS